MNILLNHSKNNLIINYNRCFQQKQGYRSYPDSVLEQSPNKKYLGEPHYQSLRYSYQLDERIQAGFVAEKDAGEPFWNRKYKGYDYYSAHLLLRHLSPVLKTLAIGDFKASFGQGLLLNLDYSPGRTSLVTQAERRNSGIRRHYSTNETDFFQGAAAELQWKSMNLQVFHSLRKRDGKVDSLSILSFKTDGLHRLQRERDQQRTIKMQTVGAHLRYKALWGGLGISGLHSSFNGLTVDPPLKPYNRYYFRGKQQTNVSVDYLWKHPKLQLYGETAYSGNGAFATLNGLKLTPVSYFTGLLLYRYYDMRYQAFFGKAFGQQTTVQNEKGVYLGISWNLFPRWKLASFVDYYHFPWLKYNNDQPSSGLEYMVQLDHTPTNQIGRASCRERVSSPL